MTINLEENERIDDLDCKGYRIIQNTKKFCFGMDAVLLSQFAKVGKGEQAVDLGTGTGVIPLLLEAKTGGSKFVGLEIQAEAVHMARRSVALNGLEDKVIIESGDIKEASKLLGGASFDVVTSNPPYMKENHGLKNPDMGKAIARHELLCTLDDVVREASKLLKPNGRLYMVHRPFRMADIVRALDRYKLKPRTIQFVHPSVKKEPSLILVEAVRGGSPMLKIQPPFIVFNEDGTYSRQYEIAYGHLQQ